MRAGQKFSFSFNLILPVHIPGCHRPRKRTIQYSRALAIESRSRGVLDPRMRGDDGFYSYRALRHS
jgi:hypothetical protein